ncbi:MAG: hypothetical protein ABIQ36_04440 [Rhodanobacter sp.]
MIRKRAWHGLMACVVFGLAAFGAASHADSWMPPTPKTYTSDDGTWRFTVTPRAINSPLAFFEDKVANHKNAGGIPGNLQKQAQGFMEHRQHGQWQAVWNRPLLNEVGPVSAIVSPTGQAVTFDNWHTMGYGKDAVVIYDRDGKPVRAMALDDFLPTVWVDALPRSVSSIWWGSGHHFSADGKQLVLQVVVPSLKQTAGDFDKAEHCDLAFDLASGRAIPPAAEGWAHAMASAEAVDARNRIEAAKAEAAFISPLTAPHSAVDQDWHGYLVEAFFRLDPEWQDGWPATNVLRSPQRDDYQASVGFLRDALHDDSSRHGALMIASPSQDNLVKVLSELTPAVPLGWLKHARVYVVADNAHTKSVAKALARTGATYIQLDPDKPIPQRKARLDRYRAQK